MLPVVDLPLGAVAVGNVAAWAVIHTATGYAAHRLPLTWLQRDTWLLRERRWERAGALYERTLRIRRWKDRVPEAGALFAGGVSKRRLPGRARSDLTRFAAETRRAEYGHWAALVAGPLAALWNPPVGAAVMVAYGVAANAPFIAIQRFNRIRAQRALARTTPRSSGSLPTDRPARPRTTGSSMP